MKLKTSILAICLAAINFANAQQWAFMKGSFDSSPPVPSNNVPSSPNNAYDPSYVPANREHGHAALSGNSIFLYGGFNGGNGGVGSDLWSYDIATNNWKYIANYGANPNRSVVGTESSAVHPGDLNRGATATDAQGNIWIFGGLVPGAITNDLWKYNPNSGNWTYFGGDYNGNTNWPAARYRVRGWFDSAGNFCIFGGASASGSYNDIWKFNPSNQSWSAATPNGGTIINANVNHASPNPFTNGSATTSGSYNGVGNAGLPAARSEYGYWIGNNDVLYIFAGFAVSHETNLGDFWKYDPNQTSGGQWTLLGGNNIIGSSLPGTAPSERNGAYCWTDNDGNFHLFGGSNTNGFYRDMWKYTVSSGSWSQEGSGYSYNFGGNQGPSYAGTIAQDDPSNKPGAQICASNHITTATHTYMLDGFGSGMTPGGYCTSGNGCGMTGMVNRLSIAPALNPNPTLSAAFTQDSYNHCSAYTNNGVDEKIVTVSNTSGTTAFNVEVKLTTNIAPLGTTLSAFIANQIEVVDATTNMAIPFTYTNAVDWERGTIYPTFPCASNPSDNWEEITINISSISANQSVLIKADVEHCNCNLDYEPSNFNVWNGLTSEVNYENAQGGAMSTIADTSNQSYGWWWTDSHSTQTIPQMQYGDQFVFSSHRISGNGISSTTPFIAGEQNVRCKLSVVLPQCFVLNTGDLSDITATDVNGATYSPTTYSIISTSPNGDQVMDFLFPVLPETILNDSIALDLRVFYNTENCSQNPIQWKMWFVPDYTCPSITDDCWLPASGTNVSNTTVQYPLSLIENQANNFSIYPNPTQGKSEIKFGQATDGVLTLRNTEGKVIDVVEFSEAEALEVDLSKEARGVYFITITTPSSNQHIKLVKNN